MLLQGKVAVVTGSGRGIGRGIALALAREGASVVINDVGCSIDGRGSEEDPAAQVCKEIQALGGKAVPNYDSVADYQAAKNIVQTAVSSFGRIDILVNNAGTNIKDRTLRELTPESWDMMIGANLNGAFYCTKAVLDQMFARRDGVIVNVVSVAGKRANPLGGAAYVAGKFGMGGLGMVLSNEEKDSGVRVSNVYPGEIDTPILSARPRPVTDEQRALILKPEDVAEAILFLCAPQNSYMTGHLMVVDGGWTAGFMF